MQVSGQFHSMTAALLGKMLPLAIEQESGWTRESVWDTSEKRKCLSFAMN